MTGTFISKIRSIQKRTGSLLCIGLDPDVNKMPLFLRHHRNPSFDFNRRIIDATADLVCAYKLNLAFYEVHGMHGWEALQRTIEHIPQGILTIADGKRGDIGNTAEMYARALFDGLGFDAVTVNPYMGKDSALPFLKNPRTGAFVLALTSNQGAKDFQYLKAGAKPLYERVIGAVKRWNTQQNCGLVVGATKPAELRRARQLAPDLPILIPGVGAQGGHLEASVRYGCTRNGDLALINVGRSIIYASNGKDFAREARKVAMTYRDAMNRFRSLFF